jgi:branched-chain amino acid transport system ATP-binding protein
MSVSAPGAALLTLERVTKRFGGLTAVGEVSLQVRPGDLLGIIGPNGAGKTTLFHLISGYFRPDEGRVVFDGHDVTGQPAHAISRLGLTRTFQIVKPFGNLSVLDNVMIGALTRRATIREARADAERVIGICGLGPHAGARARALPLALRKRLEVARALATQPRLLLLDEIAGGLTEAECAALIATIRDIKARKVTIVWVEHVVHALLAVADRLVVLNFGRKIAEGEPRAIIASREVREIYMGIPA